MGLGCRDLLQEQDGGSPQAGVHLMVRLVVIGPKRDPAWFPVRPFPSLIWHPLLIWLQGH